MQITQIDYRQLALTLKTPFKTAHDVTAQRPLILIALTIDDTYIGYGEVQAFANHEYAPQSQADALAWLNEHVANIVGIQGKTLESLLAQLPSTGQFARAGIEMAIWDAVGKHDQRSLADMLGQHTDTIPVGIALGLDEMSQLNQAYQAGYQRIKLKQSGLDVGRLADVMAQKDGPLFSLDFNASLEDSVATREYLKQLQLLGIDLIEEPFKQGNFGAYNTLAAELWPLKISLDEQLNSFSDVLMWLDKTQVPGYTIKQGKLGGIQVAKQAIDVIGAEQRLAWIGGMLASGIGRAVDAALASYIPTPQYPADISQGSRYFVTDIVTEDLVFEDGFVRIPDKPGIGITLNWSAVLACQVAPTETIKLLQKP